jgi:uncharacterized protein YqeY
MVAAVRRLPVVTTLKEQLQGDLTQAMRSRDELRTATLRMALAAVTNEEVAGKQARSLSDEDVVGLLRREAKKRAEAAAAFDSGGRPELAARERAEAAVLSDYLPAELSDEELTAIVAEAIAEAAVTGPQGLGPAMKLVQPKVAGRAAGARVAAEVRKQLET